VLNQQAQELDAGVTGAADDADLDRFRGHVAKISDRIEAGTRPMKLSNTSRDDKAAK